MKEIWTVTTENGAVAAAFTSQQAAKDSVQLTMHKGGEIKWSSSGPSELKGENQLGKLFVKTVVLYSGMEHL